MLRGLKAEAPGPLWYAVQEYASRNRLLPSPSYACQPTYDQSWPLLTSYARLEVVDEEIEDKKDVVQPESSNNGPDLEVTSHGPSVIEGKCSDAAGTERGKSTEGAGGQDMKPLGTVSIGDTEGTPRTMSKPSVSPTPKPTAPVIHILNSPPSGSLFEAMALISDSL